MMHLRNVFDPCGLVIGAALILIQATAASQPLAFPGAEGWAASTPGGRGGTLIKVTNLNADGEGSLKSAIETSGPRTVVFDVGGIIDLAGTTLLVTEPFLTIAGQSAPFPGITIIDGGIEIRGTHDIVIRHLRVRPGAARHVEDTEPWEPDGISLNFSNNVIIDHCSISWGVDENLSASGPRFEGETPEDWRMNTSHTVTFSNNLVAEALFEATHAEGKHSRASLIHDNTSEIAVIKNLYAQNNRRSPLFKAGSRGVIMNNVVYDAGELAMHYSSVFDEWSAALATVQTPPDALISVVGNTLNWGPQNLAGANPVPLFVVIDEFAAVPAFAGLTFLKLYLEDNLTFDHTGTLNPQIPQLTNHLGEPVPQYLVDEKPVWNDNLNQIPAEELAAYIARNVGARPWEADPVDDRIVSDWQNRTGALINFETDVGGFPALPFTQRGIAWDSDDDGMPDAWERLRGLNPDEMDHNGTDLDLQGYTNIEVYLDELNSYQGSECVSPAISFRPDPAKNLLFFEDFNYGGETAIRSAMNASTIPVWTQSVDGSPHTFEGFDVHGAVPRGFSNLYRSGGVMKPIPGGIEVNSIVGPATLSATLLILSSNIDTSVSSNATISFFAGFRGIVGEAAPPSVRVFNVTEGVDLLPATPITGLKVGVENLTTRPWVRKDYSLTLSESDLGDVIRVDWYGGGTNGGNGLLLVDIQFFANGKPENQDVEVTWENLPGNGRLDRSADVQTWEVLDTDPSISGTQRVGLSEKGRIFVRWVPND